VVAAILAAALHGFTHQLVPSEPIDGKALTGRDPAFPRTLWAALDRLEASQELARYIPARYLEAYAHLKRGEFASMLEDISERELDFYQ
jgi:glutamine synthetase